jgi:hypothetical protein
MVDSVKFKRYVGVEVNGKCLVIDGANDTVVRKFHKSDDAIECIAKLNSTRCGSCYRMCDKAVN